MLHIHCGDSAATRAHQATLPEVAGGHQILVWHDSSAVGPCALDFAAHRQLRARWWNADPSRMQDPRELPRDRPLVLWFGPDPWEQLALVELLAGLPDATVDVSLVPLDRGVGESSPARLPAHFARRRPAPAREPLRRLWADFCADDRSALAAAVDDLRGDPQLPHLAPALARILADRRDQLTERRVRTLVAAGVHDLMDLMPRLHALEAPGHGAWYGDAIVARLRDAALGQHATPR
ncbi:MAG TPA: DUF1835 domain-containing protein [Nannocystis sp.]